MLISTSIYAKKIILIYDINYHVTMLDHHVHSNYYIHTLTLLARGAFSFQVIRNEQKRHPIHPLHVPSLVQQPSRICVTSQKIMWVDALLFASWCFPVLAGPLEGQNFNPMHVCTLCTAVPWKNFICCEGIIDFAIKYASTQ